MTRPRPFRNPSRRTSAAALALILLGCLAVGPARGAAAGLALDGTNDHVTMGAAPEIWYVEDPSWQPGRSKAQWKRISSEGVGKPEPLSDPIHAYGNRLIARDLIRAIETDTQPKSSMFDGRAALEMILAVYESHRLNAPVRLPLEDRRHPLSL